MLNFSKVFVNNSTRGLIKCFKPSTIIVGSSRSFFTKSTINLNINSNNNKPPHQELIFTKNHKEELKQKEQQQQNELEAKPLIYEVDSNNFDKYTMKPSMPVILNVYSEKGTASPALTEALKAYASEYPGCLMVSNLNVDKNLELVKALNVQQIPTIFTIHKGQVLQQFLGLPDHESLDKIINGLIKLSGGLLGGKTIDQQQITAEAYLRSNQSQEALSIYNNLLENDETQLFRTLIGLIQCYTNLNQPDKVDLIMSMIKEKFPNELDNKKIAVCKRILQLKKQVESTVQKYKDIPLKEFEEKLTNDPTNLDLKYDLSLLYYQIGQYQDSINQLLDIIKINKNYTRNSNNNQEQQQQQQQDQSKAPDSAKNLLIKIFDSLDSQDPLVIKSRKSLNNIWFS